MKIETIEQAIAWLNDLNEELQVICEEHEDCRTCPFDLTGDCAIAEQYINAPQAIIELKKKLERKINSEAIFVRSYPEDEDLSITVVNNFDNYRFCSFPKKKY